MLLVLAMMTAPAPLNISPSTSQASASNTTVNEPVSTTGKNNQDDLTENNQDQQVRRTTRNRREVYADFRKH